MTRRCVCPGSFDPVTNGHLDVIARAAELFDEVIVAVMHNPAKSGTFEVPTRIDFIERSLPSFVARTATVRVESFADTLLVEVCRRAHAHAIVKGLRGPGDYAYELPMARMNRHMAGVETVFLPADPRLEHVSSSLVREIAAHDADVGQWVPDVVATALKGASVARSAG
ncbi:MAG: pantetheine-phosphate adenylyltransferase [Ornithinimicrobium sp.]